MLAALRDDFQFATEVCAEIVAADDRAMLSLQG
jgi:hypothetical protein